MTWIIINYRAFTCSRNLNSLSSMIWSSLYILWTNNRPVTMNKYQIMQHILNGAVGLGDTVLLLHPKGEWMTINIKGQDVIFNKSGIIISWIQTFLVVLFALIIPSIETQQSKSRRKEMLLDLYNSQN